MRTTSKLIILICALILPAAVLAAWRDAPAGPPNYGAVSPDTQADYKPMNLGSVSQTKSGGANFATDSAAGVGIGGTLTGSAKLNIVKNNPAGDAVAVYTATANSALYLQQDNASGYAIYASGGMNYFSGNVGIGTAATPGYKLHIAGAGNQYIQVQDTTANKSAWLGTQDGTASFQGNGDLTFYTNGERMRITTGGNVGIGTVPPDPALYKLDVQGGQINASGGLCMAGNCKSSWAEVVSGGITGSGTTNKIPLWSSGSSLTDSIMTQTGGDITVDNNGSIAAAAFIDTENSSYYINPAGGTSALLFGNVGIGTTGPGYKLDVTGNVNATGGLYWNGTPVAKSGDNISIFTNNSGYITDGNTGWDNSYGYITADSRIGTLTSGKWCTSNGSQVNCTSDQAGVTSLNSKTGAVNIIAGIGGITVDNTISNTIKISSTFSESDTLQSVTDRGSNTTNSINTKGGIYVQDKFILENIPIKYFNSSLSKMMNDWRLIDVIDFDDSDAISGWEMFGGIVWAPVIPSNVTTCGGSNKILGGYNVSSGTERFRKNFYSLPSGVSEAKLRFKYYSIDSWDGEWGLFGFIAHNGTNFGEAGSWKIGASYGGVESEFRYNICGNSWVDAVFYGEAVAQTYGYPYLQILAKSSLDSGPSDESYGIDKIEVWVR
ncbi:MAG TPA: hypothetical protein VJK01_02555 [Candidatus Paceibacterota bacterium]